MAHNPLHGSGQAALAHPQAQGSEATRSALLDSESGIERGVQNGMRNAWLISLGQCFKERCLHGDLASSSDYSRFFNLAPLADLLNRSRADHFTREFRWYYKQERVEKATEATC